MEKLLQFLQSVHPLSNGLLQFLSNKLSFKELNKKDYLLKEGQVCRNIYFIESGLLRCFYIRNGMEVSSWFMKEHDVIISVESFFNQKPSYESIQAIENCVVHYITFEQLQFAYKNFPEFNFTARLLIEKYYALSEQRLYAIRMQNATERYEWLLQFHPELILRVPHKYIASYLGITAETLSKIRGEKNSIKPKQII